MQFISKGQLLISRDVQLAIIKFRRLNIALNKNAILLIPIEQFISFSQAHKSLIFFFAGTSSDEYYPSMSNRLIDWWLMEEQVTSNSHKHNLW